MAYRATGVVPDEMREQVERVVGGPVKLEVAEPIRAEFFAEGEEKPVQKQVVRRKPVGPPCTCGRPLRCARADVSWATRSDWYHQDDYTPACSSAFEHTTIYLSGGAQYNKIATPDPNALYVITSDNPPERPSRSGFDVWMPRIGPGCMLVVHTILLVLITISLATNGPGDFTWPAIVANLLAGGIAGYRLRRACRPARPPKPIDSAETAPATPKPKPMAEIPVEEFTATCSCPTCGWTDVHGLRVSTDEASTAIRECVACGQEWRQR